MRCTENDCAEPAVYHIAWAKMRKCVREQHLCDNHAQSILTNLKFDETFRSEATGTLEGAHCFDISLVVISETNESQIVYLHEVGGERCFPILVGIFEAASIDRRLKGLIVPRPLTHDMAFAAIGALGGEIRDLLFSSFDEHIYYTQLRIRQNDQLVLVDARPSDGIIMAMHANAPIYILESVLTKIGLL